MIKGVTRAHLGTICLGLFCRFLQQDSWPVFFQSDVIWHLTGKFKLGIAFQWFLKCRKNLLDETFSSNAAYFLILTV